MAQTTDARVNLGPLTTTYTPAASCTIPVQQCGTCTEAWQAQTCYIDVVSDTAFYGVEDFTDCWPPRASFVPTPSPPLEGWGFYSPGLICPTGYTSACSATGGGQSDWPVQFGLLEKETAVGCCPNGYSCLNLEAQTCISYASSTTFEMVTCGVGSMGTDFLFSLPTTVFSSPISTYSVYAPLIQINFQASDLITSTTDSTTSPTSTTTSPSNTSSPSSINTHTSIPASSPGTSTGAKAGIGVGVAFAVIAIASLAFWIIHRKKRHAYRPTEQLPSNPTSPSHVYELGAANTGPYAIAELPQGIQKVEIDTGIRQGGERGIAELQ